MEYIISFFITLIEFLTYDNIVQAFFGRQNNISRKIGAHTIYFVLFFVAFEKIYTQPGFELIYHLFAEVSLIKALTVILAYTYIEHRYDNIPVTKCICIMSIRYSVVVLTELTATAGIILLLGVDMNTVLQTPLLFILVTFSIKLTQLLICRLLLKFADDRISIKFLSDKETAIFDIISLFCFISTEVLVSSNIYGGSVSTASIFLAAMIVVMTLLSLLLMINVNRTNRLQFELITRNEREKSNHQYSLAIKTAYEKQRALTHEYNNNLAVLKAMAENEANCFSEEYMMYLNKLVGNMERNQLVVSSGNMIIDAILNQKYTEAFHNGVAIDFNLENMTGLAISDEDLVTLLANSIDNAIAAAKESQQKYIYIHMTRNEYEFMYSIKNSVKEKVNIIDNTVVAYGDDIYHGFGLKNINACVKKYDGRVLLECSDKFFILTALVPVVIL